MRIFFLGPKRVGSFVTGMEAAVKQLETEGNEVFWPWRDRRSKRDEDGIAETIEDMWAMGMADKVVVWYYRKSEAVALGVGLALMMHKPLELVDRGKQEETVSKLYKMLEHWSVLMERLEGKHVEAQ